MAAPCSGPGAAGCRLLTLALLAASTGPGLADAAGAAPNPGLGTVHYRLEARTVSGLVPGLSGAAMVQMMGGQGRGADPVSRQLELRLQSPQRPSQSPRAEHSIPAGLGLGTPLVLRTPEPVSAAPLDVGEPQAPRGRLLIFRGCGEQAAAGQPDIVDLARLLPEQRRLLAALPGQKARAAGFERANGTIGVWPAGDAPQTLNANASLVGDHRVEGNYSPTIRFAVDGGHDFLPPVQLQTQASGAATSLRWGAVSGALGYQAVVSGAGQQEGDVVIWTSSTAPWFNSMVSPELDAAAAKGLIAKGVLLPPTQTSCAVSAQAMQQMAMGFLDFKAFGAPLKLAAPLKAPAARPAWTLALFRQSVVLKPLLQGQNAAGEASTDAAADPPPSQPEQAPAGFPGGLPGGLGGGLLRWMP
ncbi:MAG: hypothetical protein FJ077_06675 [Cyanobacteria bacterium K_DeepCast_35m_m2_023]|nr:hypothetical protein [Cyanobacteria bacterium K_DeepCast_35m_m2_023]